MRRLAPRRGAYDSFMHRREDTGLPPLTYKQPVNRTNLVAHQKRDSSGKWTDMGARPIIRRPIGSLAPKRLAPLSRGHGWAESKFSLGGLLGDAWCAIQQGARLLGCVINRGYQHYRKQRIKQLKSRAGRNTRDWLKG